MSPVVNTYRMKPGKLYSKNIPSNDSSISESIENVNERAKRFRLLNHVFPSNLFSTAANIVECCFLLTVLMEPVRSEKEEESGDAEERENLSRRANRNVSLKWIRHSML